VPNNFEIVSFTDDWRSIWAADPQALLPSQWRFAAAAGHDPMNMAMMHHNPNVTAFADAGTTVLRMQKIQELADTKDIVASILVKSVGEVQDAPDARHDIIGVAVATPEVSLHDRLPHHQRWQPVSSDLPLVRVEVVVAGTEEDRYTATSTLTRHVASQADELFPGSTLATIFPNYRRRLTGYSQAIAGIGSEIGCLVADGRYAWGDHLPVTGSLRRPAKVIASKPWLSRDN
jgi:hypothetical protein